MSEMQSSEQIFPEPQSSPEPEESFGDLLSQYEKSHSRRDEAGQRRLQGTVISVTADAVFLDIGLKIEGVLPLAAFAGGGESVQPGDMFAVSIQGRNEEGYYTLSRFQVAQPKDWASLERAFAEKSAIAGVVNALVKGGLSVDVGVRAFMPGSRSGARDAAELENLIGQTIHCRIIKLDVADEDVVVDRRAVVEEEERSSRERRFGELKEGDKVRGVVRSIMEYGAFIDLGGLDGLLHVGDIAWGRINKPADVLSVSQEVEAKVLKIDVEKQRISLGMKQLQAHPWDAVAGKYIAGERVRGTVTRVADFGAFVELEPGVEGLIHISEMSWAKKVRKASDLLKPGETVEVVVLGTDAGERRMSLGLKQALGDPWIEVAQRFPVGSQVEGPVTGMTKFGAFVQLAEGIEGMVHVSEISAEKRIEHPQNALKLGQTVRAQVLEIDSQKRQLRLSMKQLVPSGLEEYIAEHKAGDVVTGRLVHVSGEEARVELGEGVLATCRIVNESVTAGAPQPNAKADLSSLSAMLSERWKSGPAVAAKKQEAARAGQIRSFRIVSLDAGSRRIELDLV